MSKITTSGTGAFGFEFYNEYNEDTTYSFGRVNNVEQFKDGITYQITNSYNGIVKLDYIVNGKDNAADVSWHFVDNANCKFTITGNRFNCRFSFDSDVTKCNVLFTNNSHKEDNVFANATVMQFNNVKE